MQAVEANVEANFSTATVYHDGEKFDPEETTWVRMSWFWENGEMVLCGSGTTGNRTGGFIQFMVFDKPGKGIGAIVAIIEELGALLSRKKFGAGFLFAPSGPRAVGVVENDWERRDMIIDFRVQE